MANESFIPVAADDWYERRRNDDAGEFFRKVASQGPRKGEGGSTRQGIYCLTADGQLLAYKNAGQNADVMRDVFKQALAAWNRLPEGRRKPGAVQVQPAGNADARFSRTPPEGGLIAVVYTRILESDAGGAFRKGSCEVLGGDRAARDHLWVTAGEVKSIFPAVAKAGDRVPMPPAVLQRIARFHFLDNTRGEPPSWRRDEVRKATLSLVVESATPQRLQGRFEGSALMTTDPDPTKAARGFDVQIGGEWIYDRQAGGFQQFDLTAVGDHWGESPLTRRARPGRAPLGVSIEMVASPAKPGDRIPPQHAREVAEYFGRGR